MVFGYFDVFFFLLYLTIKNDTKMIKKKEENMVLLLCDIDLFVILTMTLLSNCAA